MYYLSVLLIHLFSTTNTTTATEVAMDLDIPWHTAWHTYGEANTGTQTQRPILKHSKTSPLTLFSNPLPLKRAQNQLVRLIDYKNPHIIRIFLNVWSRMRDHCNLECVIIRSSFWCSQLQVFPASIRFLWSMDEINDRRIYRQPFTTRCDVTSRLVRWTQLNAEPRSFLPRTGYLIGKRLVDGCSSLPHRVALILKRYGSLVRKSTTTKHLDIF